MIGGGESGVKIPQFPGGADLRRETGTQQINCKPAVGKIYVDKITSVVCSEQQQLVVGGCW